MHRSVLCLGVIFSMLATPVAVAQSSVGIDVDYLTRMGVDERLQSDGVDLMGDQIDFNTGSVVFSHTDVAIPGNFDLDVAIRRTRSLGERYVNDHDFADWELLVPRITTIVAQPRFSGDLEPADWHDMRCNSSGGQGPVVVHSDPYWIPNIFDPMNDYPDMYIVEDYEYSNGVLLEIPGQGSRQILAIGQQNQWPASTKRVTVDNWAISCIADIGAANGGGEGFIATAPNGDRYTFDKLIYRTTPKMNVADTILERSAAIMLATKVEDVDGNEVIYTYSSGGDLQRIAASDGRTIDVEYTNGLISKVIAHQGSPDQREWNYAYSSGPSIATTLQTVTLPDSRTWTFNLQQMDVKADPTYDCTKAPYTVWLTHPNGATGNFTFAEIRHVKGDTNGQDAASRSCLGGNATTQPYFDAMSLTQKTLSGTNYPAATWMYTYSGYTGGTPQIKWTEVVDPLGHKTRREFARWGDFEGLMLKDERYETPGSGTPTQTVDQTYLIESIVGTTYLNNANQDKLQRPRRELVTTNTRGTDVHTTVYEYNTTQSSTDYSHGFPTKVSRSNNYSTMAARYVDRTYAHDRDDWVLGLVDTLKRNGKLFDSFVYDAAGHHLTEHHRFGSLFRKAGYHTALGRKGAIAWVEDALAVPRRTRFDSYKRGLPQLITRADQSTVSRAVDDNGWVTSETDGNQNTVGYEYTATGWLEKIDRSLLSDPWSDTTIAYSSLGSGIVQMSTRGTTRVTTSYDSLTRPYRVKTEPTNSDGKTSYIATHFDALGQVTFVSFPTELPTPVDGLSTTYDSLGRKLLEVENVTPGATTSYVYQANHRTTVTDPENKVTHFYHHAFGDPDDTELHLIEQPHNGSTIKTWMYRNDYGQTTKIRQYGVYGTEVMDYSVQYYMDPEERVCRMSTPEGGHTVYKFNDAYEMTAYAKGVAGGTSCVTPSGSSRVVLEYDELGRLEKTLFDDVNTPDIIRTFDDNGNVLTVDRVAANPADDVELTYTYDSANNIKSEELIVDVRTYTLGYRYHADGHLEQRTYPGNVVIEYVLNGLGQPKTVRNGPTNYVTDAIYHANGSLESAAYGNGHSLTNTWTPRQQVLRNRIHSNGVVDAVDRTYAYNKRGQLTSIIDAADIGNDRGYGYDDIGRIETATGPWGTGTFDIDPLGNIRSKTLGTVSDTIAYDSATNRAASHTRNDQPARMIQYNETLDRGNVTNLGGMVLAYDYSDQPVSQTGTIAAVYRYDGNQRRVYQDIDNEAIYSFYDSSGALVHRHNVTATPNESVNYIAGGGTVVRLEDTGSGYAIREYIFADHLGSPIAATGATATVSWRERYTPYGEKLTDPPENRDEPGFTSHVQDHATGLTYMQARFYDPMLGRFLSIDPIGHEDQLNLYAYVGNDPVNAVDPTGMCKSSSVKQSGFCLSPDNSSTRTSRRIGSGDPAVTADGNIVTGVQFRAPDPNRKTYDYYKNSLPDDPIVKMAEAEMVVVTVAMTGAAGLDACVAGGCSALANVAKSVVGTGRAVGAAANEISLQAAVRYQIAIGVASREIARARPFLALEGQSIARGASSGYQAGSSGQEFLLPRDLTPLGRASYVGGYIWGFADKFEVLVQYPK